MYTNYKTECDATFLIPIIDNGDDIWGISDDNDQITEDINNVGKLTKEQLKIIN